jgi:uncharacterized MAPEG superfamily protein
MTSDLSFVAYASLLTFVMLLTASLMRARAWTPQGLKIAFGNRDDLPAASPLAGRAERAARNMLENFVLFVALVLTAHAAGVSDPRVELGAKLFFWARVVYFPVYLAGIIYLRTLVWTVGVAGLAMILMAIV